MRTCAEYPLILQDGRLREQPLVRGEDIEAERLQSCAVCASGWEGGDGLLEDCDVHAELATSLRHHSSADEALEIVFIRDLSILIKLRVFKMSEMLFSTTATVWK